MNLRSRLSALVLLGLTLFSCSKESDVLEVDTPSQTVKTQVIHVDLEAGESGELRLTQEIDDRGHAVRPFMSDKNLKIRVAVRLNNDANTIAYQTLEFTKLEGLRARYSGQLTVPSGSNPSKDRYEISGILLNEVGGEVFTEIEGDAASSSVVKAIAATELKTPQASKLDTKIPYLADWQHISIQGGVVQPVNMRFKPNGTLLRFKVVNTLGSEIKVTGIKVQTNAFFRDWKYDFKKLATNNLTMGQRDDLEEWTETFNLPSEITLGSNGESDWYYLWVMPTGTNLNLVTKISAVREGGIQNLAFQSGMKPSLGSVPVRLVVKNRPIDGDFGGMDEGGFSEETLKNSFLNGKLPFEYVSGFANATGTALLPLTEVIANNDPRIGFFKFEDASALNISGARLPSILQLRSILPDLSIRNDISKLTSDYREVVNVGGETFESTADYKAMNGERVLYGIRFKTGDNAKRMAYKYEHMGTFEENSADSRVKVSMKYVGSDPAIDIEHISNPLTRDAFWASPDGVLYLPAFGLMGVTGRTNLGTSGYFISEDAYSERDAHALRIFDKYLVGTNRVNRANKFTAILFKVNP